MVSVLALTLALAAPAAAQGTPGPGTGTTGGLLGAGVSFLRVPEGLDLEGDDSSTTFTGFLVDFRKNFVSTGSVDVGAVGEVSMHRKKETFSDFGEDFSVSLNFLTLAGGARVTASQLDRVSPFGQVLFGIIRAKAGGDICDIDDTFCESETEGVAMFGGGVDVRLTDKLNFRGQIDFVKVMEEASDIATRFTFGISVLLGGS
jgi:hypothetical protein